jgi:hypothetical protein
VERDLILRTCRGYATPATIKNRAARLTNNEKMRNKTAVLGSFALALIFAAVAALILIIYDGVVVDAIKFIAIVILISSLALAMIFTITGISLIADKDNGEES